MGRFSLEQSWEILKTYFQSGESSTQTVRNLRKKFDKKDVPKTQFVDQFVKRVRETGSLLNKTTRVRTRPVRSTENIAAVAQSVREQPSTSTRHRSQELNISRTSLRRILHKDLGMNAYKVQLVQELKPHDHLMRFRFAQWAEDRLIEDEHFYRKIIFSDEAHFHLGGYVNKQNCRIWGSENPHVIVEKPMHPQRVTVWCGFWSGGIIGPFFFENEQGNAVTVSGDRYRAMLSNFLFPKIEEDDIDDIWFQQDGATCHTANVTIDLLRTVFENRIISRNADVNWPPRSCDLTPLDFFLWGAVKDKCYAKHPETIDDLKHEIEVAIDEIEAQTIENVLKNWTDRMEYCKASRGSHLNDVVFHS
ncbi:Transposable element Tc3 transposase [Anthophora plagiata]